MTDVISCAMMGRSTALETDVFIVVVLAIFAAIQLVAGFWRYFVDVELGGLVVMLFGAGLGFCAWDWHRFRSDPPGTPVPAGTALVVALLAVYLFCVGGFCSLAAIAGTEGNHLVHPDWVWLGFPTVALAVVLITQLLRKARSKRKGPG